MRSVRAASVSIAGEFVRTNSVDWLLGIYACGDVARAWMYAEHAGITLSA